MLPEHFCSWSHSKRQDARCTMDNQPDIQLWILHKQVGFQYTAKPEP